MTLRTSHLARRATLAAGVAALLAGGLQAAHAYPDKPISIIVPFAPGGPTDTSARVVAEALSKHTGYNFVIENVPGAGSVVGSNKAAASDPDGYTLLWGTASSMSIAPYLNPHAQYVPLESFDPIAMVASAPFVLAVQPDLEVNDVKAFIDLAHANPGELNVGSVGTGSFPHMIAEAFNAAADIDAVHVPYKGGAPMITALLAGDIDYAFDTPTTITPHLPDNNLKALAVTSAERWPALPDTPTLQEAGVEGIDISTWFGLLAPAGTPQDRLDTIETAVNEVLSQASVADSLGKAGFKVENRNAEQFAEQIQNAGELWKGTIDELNISIE